MIFWMAVYITSVVLVSIQFYENISLGNMYVLFSGYCICRYSSCTFCPCAHFTRLCIPSDHIELKQLIEDSSSILHAPTFCIHVNQAAPPHKDISLKTTSNDLLMNIPTILELAHELSTRSKVIWDCYLIAAFVGKAPLSLHVAEP
jgi:hypothetical protein